MTRFWHRRSSEAILLVALAISGLFAWGTFGGTNDLNQALIVPFAAGIAAVITLVVVAASYATMPLQRLSASASLNYTLIIVTLVLLVTAGSGVNSAYLSLLVAALGFAGFFGGRGIVVATVGYAALVVQQYLAGVLTPGQTLALTLLGGLPIIAGILLWGRTERPADETKEDRSYHELASELSQVAGKSEVVINAIGDGVLALDGQGVIQLINPAAQQLLGWGKSDSLNLSYKSVFKMLNTKNQEVDSANDPVAQVLNTNKSVKNDSFSLQTQSGKNFLASISVNPVGQLGNGVIVVFRDVTTEKSDERQRAEFISTASHEMRTPVASIEGYLGLALNPATAQIDDKARDFITKAHESAQHLGRLFADLLDVSKADDSRLKNDPKVVDVVPFVRDIVQGLTPKAVEKQLHIVYKPMPDGDNEDRDPVRRLNPVLYANVDNDHLREVLQNLVENAIKYTLKGDVVVDVTGDEDHITISIADTGVGIPREDQAHLFQKFYRVDNSDTREIGGTGLGLYLCRRLTETIGGRIWVDSEYKKGSTFYVEIPRIGHDEAQRLIEQASIAAEQQAEQEQQEALHDAEVAHQEAMAVQSAPTAPTPEVAPALAPTPVYPTPQIAPTSAPPAMPAPEPIITPPQVAAPTYQQPSPEPQVYQQAPTTPVNTPLSSIEANPQQYMTRRDGGINIPPRQ